MGTTYAVMKEAIPIPGGWIAVTGKNKNYKKNLN